MRRVSVGFVALAANLALGTAAVAADGEAAGRRWEGSYAGISAGGVWTSADPSLDSITYADSFFTPGNAPGVEDEFDALGLEPNGFAIGGQLGHNWLISPQWVFGIETDFTYSDVEDSASGSGNYALNPLDTFTQSKSLETNWFLTARPRLGWVGGDAMIYVTGGIAVANVKTAYTFDDFIYDGHIAAGSSHTKAGWTIGGGIEWALWDDKWTMKAEYLHADFGNVSDAAVLTPDLIIVGSQPVFNYSTDLTIDVVRVGLNYKFDW